MTTTSENKSFENWTNEGGKDRLSASDNRIHSEVNSCLQREKDLDASEIKVEVKGSIVHLIGVVPQDSIKKIEQLVIAIPGVQKVDNKLQGRSIS